MNVKQGMSRVGIVLLILWLVACLGWSMLAFATSHRLEAQFFNTNGVDMDVLHASIRAKDAGREALFLAVGVPVVVWIAALVAGWIAKGFKDNSATKPHPESGLSSADKDEMNRQIRRWNKAINVFGGLMETYPMTVLPESNLPLPKADMKEAFRFTWFSMADGQTRNLNTL